MVPLMITIQYICMDLFLWHVFWERDIIVAEIRLNVMDVVYPWDANNGYTISSRYF